MVYFAEVRDCRLLELYAIQIFLGMNGVGKTRCSTLEVSVITVQLGSLGPYLYMHVNTLAVHARYSTVFR